MFWIRRFKVQTMKAEPLRNHSKKEAWTIAASLIAFCKREKIFIRIPFSKLKLISHERGIDHFILKVNEKR